MRIIRSQQLSELPSSGATSSKPGASHAAPGCQPVVPCPATSAPPSVCSIMTRGSNFRHTVTVALLLGEQHANPHLKLRPSFLRARGSAHAASLRIPPLSFSGASAMTRSPMCRWACMHPLCLHARLGPSRELSRRARMQGTVPCSTADRMWCAVLSTRRHRGVGKAHVTFGSA